MTGFNVWRRIRHVEWGSGALALQLGSRARPALNGSNLLAVIPDTSQVSTAVRKTLQRGEMCLFRGRIYLFIYFTKPTASN